ncbi:peptidylprolyl isomerase [Leptolyngbya sp. 7M]|uniref:peptidylprolyl isomerase n=1 Tax=Leptolyngbya sp. 7M TaxID=2812896 RepID=UPI001B8C9571|nr:peptidylprolyl isomerase [Leptolyngbya sp. 7M]QYO66325.1 peptidylprolyl isomerase [Leptolyngbya sp. 7M]
MIDRIRIFALIFAGVATFSCSSGTSVSNSNGAVKTGTTPVADSEIAVIEMEKSEAFGTMKIELYSNIAPKMVERFKQLAAEGYFDGIEFHRVNQTVIQAGNADTKPGRTPNPMKEGDSGKPNVPAEFSDVPYDVGIVGAARLGNDINSANSQFFITLRRTPDFDKKYTVFGRVFEGMNHARTISGVTPKNGERPAEPVRIKTIRIVPRDSQ